MSGPSGPVPSPGPQPPAVPPSVPPGGWPAAAPSPQPAPTAAPPPARRRRPAVAVLAVLLVLTLVGAGVLGTYLWRTSDSWRDAAADWEALAREHGAQVAQTQADLEATSSELEATRGQLATAQTRITELADEKAQLGDTTAAQQQLADYQTRVSRAAGDVATALTNCIDGQKRLIEYLGDTSRYDADDLARFRADVERVCGAATDANAALQRELAR
ncbi:MULTISPECIES: hypothetical protein [Cellulomonas]|uniref:hypothetical protein n=1 Tax=Cellulomonas TaxID=1707 RepID=UPI0006252763|nr:MULTISPECIES: hypothetical protein [Cellulomonas]